MGPLEAADGGANAAPEFLGHLKVAVSTPKVELVEPPILFFLVSDIGSDGFLIIAHCVHEEPSRPEMLAYEIAFAFPLDPSQMDCAFALDEPDNLRHFILGRDRNHHVHVIGHQMPFLDLRLFLCGKLVKHLSEVAAKFPVQRFAPPFRNKDDVIFAVPSCVA